MFDNVWFAFSYLALNIPYYALCCVPFFHRLKVRRRTLWWMFGGTAALMTAASFLLRALLPGRENVWQLPLYLVYYAACFIEYRVAFPVSLPKLLYVLLLVVAYADVVNIVARFIDITLLPQNLHAAPSVPTTLFALALLAVTMPFMVRLFRGTLRRAFEDLNDRSFWLLCAAPALFFVLEQLFLLIYRDQLFVDGRVTFLMVVLLLTALVTYYINLRLLLDTARRARLEADMQSMETQLALQAQSYRRLTENIEQTRAARHDLRHHLSVFAAYLERDDKEGLRAYLAAYTDSLPEDGEPPLCQNYAVDVVVRHYLGRARRAGARLDVHLELPAAAGVPDAELCIVFGNIFENAADSVERQRGGEKFITARCGLQGGRLVLTVDNSTNPVKAAAPPGVGMASVAAVAQRHGGTARFAAADGVYQSSVLLMTGPAQPGGAGAEEVG